MISSTTTVREVAVQIPESTRLFETLKIDYCCGGNQPLTDACEAAGVEVDNVIAMLTALSRTDTTGKDTLDFQQLSPTELINHILETHHVFTKSEMDRLTALIAKVSTVHSANHPELFKVANLFQQLCEDLRPHMFKEEQVLFPYIVALEAARTNHGHHPFAPFGTVNNPVRMMMMEHETAGSILHELRALTSDYKPPADACTSYETLYRVMDEFEKDLYQHIHLENNLLFPKSIELERMNEP
jgi:regulator of cell morphogenesis and NO signaling